MKTIKELLSAIISLRNILLENSKLLRINNQQLVRVAYALNDMRRCLEEPAAPPRQDAEAPQAPPPT